MSAPGFGLTPDQLADVFPFHVVFGRDLRIQQVGRSWAPACPAVAVGAAFDDVLRLVRPSLPPTFEHVAAHPRAIFLLACRSSGLVLRGQMMRLHDDALAFLGGPWVTDVGDVARLSLSLADLPVHDPLPDFLFLLQGKNSAIADAKRLAEQLRTQTDALQAANGQLRAIVDTAAEGIISIDETGTVQAFNAAAARLFGYEPGEVIGRNVAALMSAPEAAAHDAFMSRYLRGGDARVVGTGREVQGRRRDGTLFPLYLAVSEVRSAGRRTFTGILRDLSEQKRAAEALQESETRMRLIIDTALDAVVGMDADGRISEWSARAEQLFGWRRDEVLGQSLSHILIPLRHRAAHEAGLRAFLASGEGPVLNRRIEVTAIHRDGREFPVELSISPLCIRGTYSFSGFVRDITEQKRAEADLRAAKEAAEGASRAKSEFLATMSHEIRTPMNGVIGMAGLLLDTHLDAEQREYAETVRKSADALLAVINDILDFSKVEAGQLQIETIDFAPREVVGEVLDLLRRAAEEKGLQLVADVAPALPEAVCGDPGRLRQVLTNLVSNAIKFTARGSVRVAVEAADGGAGAVGLRFSVRDTGIGIAADAVPKLFQPFSQADGTTTRRYGGTGLGLAISKRLCELMGGAIGVDSTPGFGSTFWFTIRCAAAAPRASAATRRAAARPRARRPGRVLVAEDNPINQRVAVLMLERLGCRADAVGNGREVLDALARHPYDLVLMDCQMPDMDGYTAAAEIRCRERGGQRTPIVAMTANALQGDRQRCLAAGMDDYVPKPVREDDLDRALARWLPESVASARSAAAWDAEPSFDPAVLLDLTHIGAGLVEELVTLFERIVPGELAAMEKANEDADALGRLAHRLRSSCLHLGARRMAAVCGSLEQMGPGGRADPATIRAALAVLQREFEIVRAELASVRAWSPPGSGVQ